MTTDDPNLAWDDPDLGYDGDSRRTASYRKGQSRWREMELGLPYGRAQGRGGKPGKYVGSMLAEPSDRQWLTAEVADFARRRMTAPGRPGDAAINDTRLYRNLLSSMPLCFNIFGQFDAHRAEAAQVMSALLELDVAAVTDVWVEYAPRPARQALGDRTAFDAWMTLDLAGGERRFLAVETKYTEPFSPTPHWKPTYREVTNAPGGWFMRDSDATARLGGTNQLWRNLLLAQLTEQHCQADGVGTGMGVVLSLGDDRHAQTAVEGLAGLMVDPSDRLMWLHLDRLTDEAARLPALRDWARAFQVRYLNPVL